MEQNFEVVKSPIQSIIEIINQDETIENKRLLLDEFHNFDLAKSLLEMTPLERKTFFLCFSWKPVNRAHLLLHY